MREEIVMECPKCEHRIMLGMTESMLNPSVYCGCGDLELMDVVHDD